MADFTKGAGTVILNWTDLPDGVTDNPFATTGVQTTPDELEIVLDITVAHVDANAAATGVKVQVWRRIGSTNEDWRLFHEYEVGVGTAVREILNANSGAGVGGDESEIHVADTTDWDDTDTGQVLFLWDAVVVADSCLVNIVGWSDNVHYNADHALVNGYTNAQDYLLDGVVQNPVVLPASTIAYKVNFHNTDADANFAVNVLESTVTDIA